MPKKKNLKVPPKNEPTKDQQLAILEQEKLQAFGVELQALQDKHGFDLQIQQGIVPVRRSR